MWFFSSSTAARSAFIVFALIFGASVFAQTQTTGSIEGTIRDQNGALVVGAVVIVSGKAIAEQRTIVTDDEGRFHVGSLAPGSFELRISAGNFLPGKIENVIVSVSGVTTIDVVLQVGDIAEGPVTATDSASTIKTDSAMLGRSFDGRTAAELPLATRNVTQLLILAPGVESFLFDASVVGRGTQAVSVNGARVSQNSFQINGIETFGTITTRVIANPAPEAIVEFKIQTSLHDASLGRVGGGIIQTVTRSGANDFSGSIYDYFGDTSLNANNPFLKAAGLPRPVLERNVFGVTIGGPIKHDRSFFFFSSQATREQNGASLLNSLSPGVLIGTNDTALTDDRSEQTLRTRFGVQNIHPISRKLLNSLLPNGEFLIPTPQLGSRYYVSSISYFRELQFNANLDYRFSDRDLLTAKLFFADAPQTVARSGVINVPGFPVDQDLRKLSVSIQLLSTFSPDVTNEARIGTGLTNSRGRPRPPFRDSDFGIQRANSSEYPGFPVVSIAAAAGGLVFGSPALAAERSDFLTPAFTDTLSFTRRAHSIRLGAEIRYYHFNINIPIQTRGNLTFTDFRSFLSGTTSTTRISTGISDRAFRTTDYNLFVQDDWKVSRRLTLNLGLRYELDLPPYDTRGRIATFDPLLYRPPVSGVPPQAGLVQAGNPVADYDLSDIPNVGKRVVNSIDANNFAPRVGLAYQPFLKRPLVFRAGYGIYYSRSIFSYVVGNIFHPPFYFSSLTNGRDIQNPFPTVLTSNNAPLFGLSFDRNIRTPYVQQFNGAVQLGLSGNSTLEIAYVGSRGINLFRQVAINQASLVPGGNTPTNVQQRVPFQGVLPGAGFTQDQTTAMSSYHSAQASLVRRFSLGLQFQISYTLSKSIDNASGGGGGGSPTGLTDTQLANESATIIGNQFDSRANRGLSNFDRRHRFAAAAVWQVPALRFGRDSQLNTVFANWRISAIVVAMSGLPVDVIDTGAATFYFGQNAGGARPNYVPGVSPSMPVAGYYFNPFAFKRPVVGVGATIPSSNGAARAGAPGTDFGNVGRNTIEGPSQFNTDLSISKTFKITESKALELRTDIFNLFNIVNFANPISNFNAVDQRSIDQTTGEITVNAGDFGRIIATSNNPRVAQLALKFSF